MATSDSQPEKLMSAAEGLARDRLGELFDSIELLERAERATTPPAADDQAAHSYPEAA